MLTYGSYAGILRYLGYTTYCEETGGGHYSLRDDGQGVYIAYWNHPTDPEPTLSYLETFELEGYKDSKKRKLIREANRQMRHEKHNVLVKGNREKKIIKNYEDAAELVDDATTSEEVDNVVMVWEHDLHCEEGDGE